MTLHQFEAFAIIAGMLALFVSDRLRYDVVAAVALSAALLTGIVPVEHAFEGFANPVIIIIGSVLVLGRAIAASGVIESGMRRVLGRLGTTTLQVGVLTACVTFLSAIMKNVGTLGIFMPIAIQTAARSKRPASLYLMPLSFGSLVGGTITLVGTSPNLLISTVRQEVQGVPFGLFDFTPVGLPLAVVAVAFLAFGWRLIPHGRQGQAAAERAFEIADYTSEAVLPEGAALVGRTVGDLEALGEDEVSVLAIIREGGRRYIPTKAWTLFAGDVLVLQGDPVAVKPVLDGAGLELQGAVDLTPGTSHADEMATIEAVVTGDSLLVGGTASSLQLRRRFEVNLLAMSRAGRRIVTLLRSTRFGIGDTVVLQGRAGTLAETVARLGCLPLAERNLTLGRRRSRWFAVSVLAVALGVVALGLAPAEEAFFVAAVAVVLLRVLTPKEALDAVDWPIIVMLGCLIPVGDALRTTGAATLIGDLLTVAAGGLPGWLAVGLLLVVAMLVTPFLHHAAAVLVMGPVAAVVAHNLGYRPEPFLMAVALGASCDFLTPIGHQNNLLVMGPGGYRFGDYWRLGLPLTILVAVLGTGLVTWAWPLR